MSSLCKHMSVYMKFDISQLLNCKIICPKYHTYSSYNRVIKISGDTKYSLNFYATFMFFHCNYIHSLKYTISKMFCTLLQREFFESSKHSSGWQRLLILNSFLLIITYQICTKYKVSISIGSEDTLTDGRQFLFFKKYAF